MNIIELDPTVLATYMKELDLNTVDNPSREIVRQIGLCAFWGARAFAIVEGDVIVSFNMTKFGKRKKNVWEPYANWFLAYTTPQRRLQGNAKALGLHVRNLAIEAGCVRMRSLAGSWAGACMHNSMGDHFWGMTVNHEVIVDTPIVEKEWPSTIPGAVRNAGGENGAIFNQPATLKDIEDLMCGPHLRYDK